MNDDHMRLPVAASTCLALVITSSLAHAQTPPSKAPARQVGSVQRQLAEQRQQIEKLQAQVQDQEQRYRDLLQRLEVQEARTAAPPDGKAVATAATPAAGAAEDEARPVRVGVAPSEEVQRPAVAPLFDEPGILTPKGGFVLEPSVQYGYSSSNRVALVGYTVIPALLIGLVDVREVKRNTLTAALTGRWGVTNRLELEAKLPFVGRSDSVVSREIFTGSANERVFDSRGKGLGDVELAARYQINDGSGGWPYMIGGLRYRMRTGKDPFEVVTDCVTRCIGNTTGTGLPLDLPTGSGFNALQASLTWLLPTDPAVFFGGLSYTRNFGRDGISRQVLNGQSEYIGSVKPGDIWGMNFGMGLALNDRSSFSMGMELSSIGKTRQNGQPVVSSVRTQLASLLLGYSYRYNQRTSFNLTVGAGLTRDTPDLTLTLRVPVSF